MEQEENSVHNFIAVATLEEAVKQARMGFATRAIDLAEEAIKHLKAYRGGPQ